VTRQGTDSNDIHGALAAHASDCAVCGTQSGVVDQIAAILAAGAVEIDVAPLTGQSLSRLRPELARLARVAFWRQVLVATLLALIPLPLIVAYNTLLLGLLYDLLSGLLPAFIATYIVGTEAALLLLLCGVTYAAIPVIVARNLPRPLAAA
jgi:hypothetical protein